MAQGTWREDPDKNRELQEENQPVVESDLKPGEVIYNYPENYQEPKWQTTNPTAPFYSGGTAPSSAMGNLAILGASAALAKPIAAAIATQPWTIAGYALDAILPPDQEEVLLSKVVRHPATRVGAKLTKKLLEPQ